MTRNVAFLEKTARAMPDRDIRHSGVMVCFGSIAQEFTYWQTHTGGSLTRLTRESAESVMQKVQS